MRKLYCLVVVPVLYALPGRAQTFEPLTPVQTIELPDVPEGPYTDHLCVDTKGHRLFTTIAERCSGISLWEILTRVHIAAISSNSMLLMETRRSLD
jgi:hypothetical protein